MEYTAEQRDLIRRIGEVSARMDQLMAEHRMAHAAAGQNLIDAVTALTTAIRQSNEIGVLFTQHGDLFREFLDTL
jgi:hypothetical protein